LKTVLFRLKIQWPVTGRGGSTPPSPTTNSWLARLLAPICSVAGKRFKWAHLFCPYDSQTDTNRKGDWLLCRS